MKTSTVGTYPQVAHKERVKNRTEGNVASTQTTFQGELISHGMQQAIVKRATRAAQRWPEKRMARVEELQKQVKEGTYVIDCKNIAECILKNETPFI